MVRSMWASSAFAGLFSHTARYRVLLPVIATVRHGVYCACCIYCFHCVYDFYCVYRVYFSTVSIVTILCLQYCVSCVYWSTATGTTSSSTATIFLSTDLLFPFVAIGTTSGSSFFALDFDRPRLAAGTGVSVSSFGFFPLDLLLVGLGTITAVGGSSPGGGNGGFGGGGFGKDGGNQF